MNLLLRVQRIRDGEADDDPDDDDPEPEPYESKSRPTLCMRCYACAGCGKLWVTDELWPRGRQTRCVACLGTGRVTIPG
jgi:hypothetical protein